MPAIQRSEFSLALNQVANERGVDVSVVLDTVKNAILAAYKKDHPGIEIEEHSATLDKNSGEAKIFYKDKDVTPPGFGRIAAQTAKQVILQKIREKEKEAIISDYKMRIGTVVNGMVLRFAGPNIIVDVGKTEAVMPSHEQIPNEKYHLNQRLTVYLLEIREGLRGEELIVSRAANGLLEGLFKREVPEVAQGSVEIKDIARETGSRSKIAVYSSQSGIDPVGSCVGQKGVRVQAVIAEFGGLEKIDIVQWQENLKDYIGQALSPAKNVRVEINEDEKTAHVFVPSEELSLAIGREGQNVRLASKLTKYRIEIEGEPTVAEAMAGKETSENIKNKNGKIEEVKKEEKEMSPKIQKKSRKAGSGSARKKSTKKAKKAGKKSKEESA
ncbi:MAG: transcription termination factor NusA [Candidatus Levybacteria bacterium RIFCSPHIGHO2_01_FULL_37_33]|nr:MAG: transcription termination factor NusA [Candidatus Levybacteria bacterium RIFCSPHIGHO2_01_FULL_37_33]OGH32511.1 MAG: transcription termination factor NusA [Candidatus Levybacteria bacterium RIFCSPLOWO2_01_FULL_36_54]